MGVTWQDIPYCVISWIFSSNMSQWKSKTFVNTTQALTLGSFLKTSRNHFDKFKVKFFYGLSPNMLFFKTPEKKDVNKNYKSRFSIPLLTNLLLACPRPSQPMDIVYILCSPLWSGTIQCKEPGLGIELSNRIKKNSIPCANSPFIILVV